MTEDEALCPPRERAWESRNVWSARTGAFVVVAVLGMAAWLAYAWELSRTVPADLDIYDFANNFLYAWDMLRGNWLLHGWVVTQDPHWLTDDLLYVLGLRVRGFDPALLHAEPVIMYTIVVALTAWASIVSLNLRAPERVIVMGIAVLPLVFPSSTLSAQVLVGPYHTGTTAVALAAILALMPRAGPERRGARIALPILGGVLLAAGRIGDPYMLTLGIAPLIVVALYGSVSRPQRLRHAWTLPMRVALAAWVAATGSLWLIPHLGGFTMRGSLAPFIPLSELGQRLVSFLGTFLDLSGGNIFGMTIGNQLIFALPRLAYLCAATWAITHVLKDLRRGRESDWTTAVLTVAILVSAVGTFLYGPNDYLGNEHRAPVFILMGIVLARRLATSHREWPADLTTGRVLAGGLLCGTLLFPALPIEQFRHPRGFDDPAHFRQVTLARWLEQHGLRHGYGSYDTASIITVETRGRVTVRALISTNQYSPLPRSAWKLIPNIELMAKHAWYAADRPGTFLVVDNGDVEMQTALQTFGAADHIFYVAGFQILTWHRGIVCTLPSQTPKVRAEERAGIPPREAACRRLE